MTNTYLYCGPFAIVTCKVGEVPFQMPKCTKEGCDVIGKDVKGEFCPKCGSKIGETTLKRTEPLVNFQTLSEEASLKGKMQPRYAEIDKGIQKVTWTPCDWTNKERTLERDTTWNSRTSHFYQTVQPEQIITEMRWFEEKYAPEIAVLRAKYGDVNISWGITTELG